MQFFFKSAKIYVVKNKKIKEKTMIKFGTSGYRAVVGEGFTKEAVQRVAYGLVEYSKTFNLEEAKVAVGFDNRFMGEMFAKWCIEVLATKCQIRFYVNSVPTPLISNECKECDFGFMITSSHNPFYYNGIKLFKKGALEMGDDETKQIADFANAIEADKIPSINYVDALESGKITKVAYAQKYLDSLKSCIDVEKVKGSKIKILINPMHGSGAETFKTLIEELDLKRVELMNDNIDPYFEHDLPAPGKKALVKQSERVREEKFDFGFAVDGDADRFSLIDSDGEYYDCNFVAPVIYSYLVRKKGMKGAFIKNFSSSNLGPKIAEASGQSWFEVATGFKNIGEKLITANGLIGAEGNGIAYANHIPTKDGILASVLMLEILVSENKPFAKILEELRAEVNFKSSPAEKSFSISKEKKAEISEKMIKLETPDFEEFSLIDVNKIEDLKFYFEGGYWAIVRLSGTEPVVRLSAEMETKEDTEKVISILQNFYSLN